MFQVFQHHWHQATYCATCSRKPDYRSHWPCRRRRGTYGYCSDVGKHFNACGDFVRIRGPLAYPLSHLGSFPDSYSPRRRFAGTRPIDYQPAHRYPRLRVGADKATGTFGVSVINTPRSTARLPHRSCRRCASWHTSMGRETERRNRFPGRRNRCPLRTPSSRWFMSQSLRVPPCTPPPQSCRPLPALPGFNPAFS
ncbi:hypothetical protein BC826DRAFT_507848 [Russula brevipes]|nr:hypothetical protein BC826DRAFT_507848 [Russula brevipes]